MAGTAIVEPAVIEIGIPIVSIVAIGAGAGEMPTRRRVATFAVC